MQIIDLAYRGNIKEQKIRGLIEKNGNSTYKILMLKSANHLGGTMLEENSDMQFADTNDVVEITASDEFLTEGRTSDQSLLAARTNVTSALSTISALRNDLNSKMTTYDVAKKENEQGVSGGREEDVLSAEASLKQSLAALSVAKVNLEKTIIKSPINGTINKLNIEKGSFVSVFEDVALVSNNNALEVISYITEKDRSGIKVGSRAVVEGSINGVVSEIAHSIDPILRKIEIKITIETSKKILTNGQSVKVEVERDLNQELTSKKEMTVPISSIKVEFNGNYIFSVDENNELVKHQIEIGPIVGAKIILLSGVLPDLKIVTDARGLRGGQKVLIKE